MTRFRLGFGGLAVGQRGDRGEAASSEGGYTSPKACSFPEHQWDWLQSVKASAMQDKFELQNNTIVREAMERLMSAGGWKELENALRARHQRELRMGRPKGS